MRVLIFTSQLFLQGGSERLGLELAVALNRQGIKTDILSLYSEQLHEREKASTFIYPKEIEWAGYLNLAVNPGPLAVLAAIFRLKRILRDRAYDVVETSQSTPTIIATCAAWLAGVAHVAGLHCTAESRLTNVLSNVAFVLTLSVARASKVYAVSEYVRKSWINRIPSLAGKVALIYNCISTPPARNPSSRDTIRTSLNCSPDENVLLFVGRLDLQKGFESAVCSLLPVMAEERWRFVLAGHVDHTALGLVEVVKSEVRRWNCEDRVKFIGRIDDVFALMNACDLLIHPTRSEAFGLVLVEAMATGLPVVTTDVDGIPEVVAETDCLMVPPDDQERLLEGVRIVLNRTARERAESAERGRAKAAYFSSEVRTEAMIQLFNAAILHRTVASKISPVGRRDFGGK